VKFWDASAIVPLLVAERTTRRLQALAAKDPVLLVWWGSEIECVSALTRLERDGALSAQALTLALRRLRQLTDGWHEIDPSDAIREAAARFLRVHPLRAADALQLAAAFLAAERRPASLEIVTLDERLGTAARKEGFVVMEIEPAE
jgi:predicted nucleic acid-binding protein